MFYLAGVYARQLFSFISNRKAVRWNNNEEKRTVGKTDIPLSQDDVEQAKKTARESRKRNYQFNLAFSSPLKRALQTAEILQQQLGIKSLAIEKGLAERNLGVLQGLTNQEAVSRYPNLFSQYDGSRIVLGPFFIEFSFISGIM